MTDKKEGCGPDEKPGEQTQPLPRPGAIAQEETLLAGSRQMLPSSGFPEVENRFTILHALGSGGMGGVWRAHDRELGCDVALKFMHSDLARDAALLQRFEEEARTLGSFREHPHIVHVYDVRKNARGKPYIVMELLSGHALDTLIEEMREGRKQCSIVERVTIVQQIGEALAALHAKGIIHRDVKPANVMLCEGLRAVLTDFGLGKHEGANPAITMDGAFMGTPLYASPEQLLGEALTPKSDLFSLGLLAFELLSGGIRAITGENISAIIAHIVMPNPVPLLSSVAPAMPRTLDTLVSRLLEKGRDRRLSSAQECVDTCTRWRAETAAHPRFAESLGPIRAWRNVLHEIHCSEREIVHLESGIVTDEIISRHRALKRALTRLRKSGEPMLREDAEHACATALDDDRLSREDRRYLIRSFLWKAVREAEFRRDAVALRHFTHELERTNALGSEGAKHLLARERTILVTSEPHTIVSLARVAKDGARKVPGALQHIGVTPCTVTVPGGGEWCLLLEAEGYRPLMPRLPGCGLRTRVLHYRLFTPEEIGATYAHIHRGSYPIGGDPISLASRQQRFAWLDDFFIERRPVTRALYARFLAALSLRERRRRWPSTWPRPFFPWTIVVPEPKDAPVNGVSVEDAFAYCDWLSFTLGEVVLLPSEDQLEAAMRSAGGDFFPWGDEFDDTRVANVELGIAALPSVGSFTPDSQQKGVDRAWSGAENFALISNFCRSVAGSMLPIGSSRIVAVRTGAHWESAEVMFRACSRVAYDRGDRSPRCGFRTIRFPKRPWNRG